MHSNVAIRQVVCGCVHSTSSSAAVCIRQVVLRLCRLPWESLWLSVKPTTRLAAVPPEAKPLLILSSERKAEGFPRRRQSRAI